MSRLDLVVGPNGAGKSTFIALVLLPEVPDSILVNADEIAAARWPEDQAAHAYDAAAIADETRTRLLLEGQSFIAETVFSHPSKLQLIDDARQRGYRVVLQVVMVPEDVSVVRVAARVAAGGHDVPQEKVRQRWRRLWANVASAAEVATPCTRNGSWTKVSAMNQSRALQASRKARYAGSTPVASGAVTVVVMRAFCTRRGRISFNNP